MSTRIILFGLCAIVALAAVPMMFGLLPPNPKIGIRLAFTLHNPTSWYAVHGVVGWVVFAAAIRTILWLRRHPNSGRASPLTLVLLAMAALFGSSLG